MTQQPVLVSISRIISILRKEGSMDPGDLLRKVDMPRKTFYRALNALKESGVVVTQNGKNYWYEFLDIQIYDNDFEAKLALDHSVNIASGLKHLIEPGQTYYIEGELMPNPEYVELGVMHLKTGYNQTFNIFEEAEEVKKQARHKEHELEEEIQTRLLSSTLKPQYPDYIVKIILSDIKEVLRGRDPYFLNDIRIQNGAVKSGSYTHLSKPEMFDSLKRFIDEEESSVLNKKRCMKIVEFEGKYYDLRKGFELQVRNLIMQVENGTPIKGRCHSCPKVRISSVPTWPARA